MIIRKYLRVFTAHVEDALVYRVRLFVFLLVDLGWLLVLPFIWLHIYGTEPTLAGYDRREIVSYFFYIPLVNSLIVYFTYFTMQREIKDGYITNYLTKPIQYLVYVSCGETGYRLWQTITVLPLMAIAYIFLKDYIVLPQVAGNILVLLTIIPLSVMLNILCATIIGMIGFWTIQAEWITHFWWMITTFANGYIAPIAFYPHWASTFLSYTPFPLLVQVPIEAIMGRLTPIDVGWWSIVGLSWIIILIPLNAIVWRRGVRRLDAVGI